MPQSDHSVHLDSLEEGRLLREFFRDSGYEARQLTAWLGRVGPPSQHRRDLPILLHQTREPNRLNTLLRWFVIGQPVEGAAARAVIPEAMLRLLLKSGMLVAENDSLAPAVIVLPLDDLLTVCDRAPRNDPRPDVVVGMTPSARVLTQFTIPRKVGAALDLCCGSGIHALQMVSQCDSVAASDLNPRALQYARFNAQLNGVENIELAVGDTFAPFEGRCFDLIVSNPPFFLLPSGDFLFNSNPLELDGFAENLARQAPRFLNEGGFFQMIFEWVEVEGQSWQQRLADWVSESGCDVWLIKHYSQRPIDYCHARMRTLDQVSVEHDVEMLARWTEYFGRHRVASMHGGMIAMRKRSGQRNWVEVEDAPFHIESPFGDLVEAVFAAHDLVTGADDDALLAIHPRLSPLVRLEQVSQASPDGWAATSVQLKLEQGLERTTRVDQHAAAFLAECTGERSLGELIELYLPTEGPQAGQVRAGCIAVMRQLMRRGFLLNGRA